MQHVMFGVSGCFGRSPHSRSSAAPFTEGFGTRDLKKAKELLDELST
jgi:hypothetical protein